MIATSIRHPQRVSKAMSLGHGMTPDAAEKLVQNAHARLWFHKLGFIAVFAIVLARLVIVTLGSDDRKMWAANLTFPTADAPAATAQLNTQPTIALGARARIVDRNGKLLATSIRGTSLYANPQQLLNPVETAQELVRLIPSLDYATILKRLQSNRQFVWIKRDLTPQQVFAVNKLGNPGLDFQKEAKRLYPGGTLFAHAVGYTNVDGKGQLGLERYAEPHLTQSSRPLVSTLDSRVQYFLHDEIKKTIDRFRAKGGAGVVMDVRNGEVLAMASLPDFDPNALTAKDLKHQFNRVSQGVYELGSMWKIISTAAALDKTSLRLEDGLDARKPLQRAGFRIRDFHAQKRMMNIAEVFVHSSNIGTALLAERVGTPKMTAFFERLGLMSQLRTDITETGRPLIPEPWRDINTLTASYGHGMAVSPLQLAGAISSIINGGYKVTPHFIKGQKPAFDGLTAPDGEAVVSARTSRLIRQMMRITVTDGTARSADVAGYQVGGKTGTAEKIGAKGYDSDKLLSSFVAVFPTDAPKYLVMVTIDEPQGRKDTYGFATGGWVAAPAVGQIIRHVAPILDMTPRAEDNLRQVRQALRLRLNKEGRLASY